MAQFKTTMNQKQFEEITRWQDDTFRTATIFSKLKHLKEEITELEQALIADNTRHELSFEIADCYFLLAGIAHKCGMDYKRIVSAIEAKFTINKARVWGKPDADGMSKHVEEKPYPIVDGHRKHYVHYPVKISNGKWVAVDVYLPSGHSIADLNLARTEFKSFDDCMIFCRVHNLLHGWSDAEVSNIVSQSMNN